MIRAVLLVTLVAGGLAQEGGRDPRFLSGLLRAGADVQRQMEALQRQMSSVGRMGSELGYLSRNIEDQISDSLPPYLRAHPAPLEGGEGMGEEGVEAVVGKLGGDAVDDGLAVIMEGEDISLHSPEAPKTQAPEETKAPESPENPARPVPARPDSPLHGDGFKFHFNLDDAFGGLFSVDKSGLGFRWGNRPQPWWRGENVCVSESVVDEGENTTSPAGGVFGVFSSSMESKSCVDSGDTYTCTTRISRRGMRKTVTEEFSCCHGHRRTANGHCTEVDLKPMDETLKSLGLAKLASMAASASMDLNSQNLTVFAPSDEALEDFVFDMEEDNGVDVTSNEVYRRRRSHEDSSLAHTLMAHFAKGVLYPGDLKDEQLLEPMWGSDSLRVNVYKSRARDIVTVNCAKIAGEETPTWRGVVYQVGGVVTPAQSTLAELVATDPQFSKFHQILRQSGALEQLGAPGNTAGHFTLLAPTDAAFAALPAADWLAAGPCSAAIANNHILPNTICSAAIVSPQSRTLNLLGNYLKVRLDQADKMFVGDAQIISKDIIASNGVMHIIDTPLIPSESKSVLNVLESRNLTEFMNLLKLAEMEEEMLQLEGAATIFAPTNEAVKEAKEYLDEIKGDRAALRTALRYHLAKAEPKALLRNNLLSDTHAGHPLRLNVYTGPMVLGLYTPPAHRSRVTAGCGRVALTGARACRAAIHEVAAFLRPPRGSLADALQRRDDFSIFSKMARDSSLAAAYEAPASALTVLAPSDHVFRTLPQRELQLLLDDRELQEELVKRHTLTEHVCCAGVAPSSLLQERSRTAHGSALHFRRTGSGLLRAGAARVTRCGGSEASNGVLHTVDRLFVTPPVEQSAPHSRWAQERVSSRPVFSVSPDRLLGDIFHNMFARH